MRNNLKDRIADYFDDLLWDIRTFSFYMDSTISLLVKFVWTLFATLLVCGLFFLYKITTLAAFIVIVSTVVITYKITKRKIEKSYIRR